MSMQKQNERRYGLRAIRGLIIVAVMALLFAGCSTGPTSPDAGLPVQGAAGSGETYDLTELAGNLSQYYGQIITVRGDFGNMVGDNIFELEAPSVGNFGTLLIVPANDATLPADFESEALSGVSDYEIEVTGVVREFQLDDVATEVTYPLDTGILERYERQPMMLANIVRIDPVGDAE